MPNIRLMFAFLLAHFQPPLHGAGHQIGGLVVCPMAHVGDGDQGVVFFIMISNDLYGCTP